MQICPLNGEILCKAVITICALQDLVPYGNRNIYIAECYFTWNIISNAFDLIEAPVKLQTQGRYVALPLPNIPITVQKNLLVMKHIFHESKTSIRDYNNHYEICMDDDDTCKYNFQVYSMHFIYSGICRVWYIWQYRILQWILNCKWYRLMKYQISSNW